MDNDGERRLPGSLALCPVLQPNLQPHLHPIPSDATAIKLQGEAAGSSDERLRQAQEKLHAIVNAALDAVVGMNAEGYIIGWNRQAEKIFGWSEAEALGRALHETIIPHQYRDAHVRGVQRFNAGGGGTLLNSRIEIRGLHRDGHEFPIELAIAPIKLDGVYEFSAFIRDISERKRAEERKRGRHRVLEMLAAGAPLNEILAALIADLEEAAPGMQGSVLLLDGEIRQLVPGCATDMAEFFAVLERDLAFAGGVGAGAGAGGIADFCRTRIVVNDIQVHPDWVPYHAAAQRAGLVSCWLEPVLSTVGAVLGTFAVFRHAPQAQTPAEIELITHAASLAGFAIERRRAEDALQLAAMVYQHSGEAMMVTDADNRVVAINPAYTHLTGFSAHEVVGKKPKLMNSVRHGKAFYKEMWETLRTTGRWQGEVWSRRKNGEEFAEWLSINTITNEEGAVHRYVAFFADITDKKRFDEVIWKQANYDLLTGLPNRSLFRDRLEVETRKADRSSLPLALLFIDLDHFKLVNDTLGHDVGDTLLIEAARRVSSSVRASDTVARLGGDELTIILPELSESGKLEQVAQKILDQLAEPFRLGGEIVYLSASIGITLYPNDAATPDGLLKNADQAMYVAKKEGRNRYSYYTSSMQNEARTRLRLTNDLRDALALGQLQVHFQPIVELAGGRICKAEALLRWRHPQRGMVGPAEFIPLAEESGLINEIGDWVFKESASWAQRWSGLLGYTFEISVNKSPVQFLSQAKYTDWPAYLAQLGLPRHCIAVEITEGLLLNATSGINEQLRQYREAGIQVSIDDFGTGYSSMSYLKKFHVDYLKIDQSFVRDMTADAGDRAIAEAIIVMAHKLGMKVIAEGIETDGQRDLLVAAECDFGQGYLFSKAVPAQEFEALLMANCFAVRA